MARSKAFDAREAVRSARAVFWERGYAATSLAQLQSATGLNKSSLYQTYGSKRGLFDQAMQSYLDEVIDPLLAPLEADDAGRAELINYFRAFTTVFRAAPDSEATRGCLMLNTAVELNDLDDAATVAVNRYRMRVRSALFNAARHVTSDARAAQLRADLLAATQIGMMITSRFDPHQAADLADELVADIEGWR